MTKQERAIIHFEIDSKLFYYGNLKVLCDIWNKENIGISYNYIKNYDISEDNPVSRRSTPRKGTIITTSKARKKTNNFNK